MSAKTKCQCLVSVADSELRQPHVDFTPNTAHRSHTTPPFPAALSSASGCFEFEDQKYGRGKVVFTGDSQCLLLPLTEEAGALLTFCLIWKFSSQDTHYSFTCFISFSLFSSQDTHYSLACLISFSLFLLSIHITLLLALSSLSKKRAYWEWAGTGKESEELITNP